MKSFNLIKV